MPYPWHTTQWEQLRLAVEQDRLTHALLLSGAEGSGMGQFALEFSRFLLCEAPAQGAACGQCRSCILFDAGDLPTGNHPDIRLIEPKDNSARIKVEAIRDLIAYLQLSSQYGRRKIAVIEPAEGMNRHSANSLLKTLEEPAPLTLLILVSYQPARLPVTIRSRCGQLNFNRIDRQSAADWLNERIDDPARTAELLELAGSAPLKALALNETGSIQRQEEILADLQAARVPGTDPMKIAGKWQQHDVTEVMTRLLFLFSRMAELRAANVAEAACQTVIDGKLCRIAAGLQLPQALDCYDLSLKNHHLLTGGTNVNKQGLLEEIIVRWQSIHR